MATSKPGPHASENLIFSLTFGDGDALLPPGEHAFLDSVFPVGEHIFPASKDRLHELVRALEIDGQEVRVVPRLELLRLAPPSAESSPAPWSQDPFGASSPHRPFQLRGLRGFLERHWPRVEQALHETLLANAERCIEARLEFLRELGSPDIILDHEREIQRRVRASPSWLATLDYHANVPNPYRQALELLLITEAPDTVSDVVAEVGKLVQLAAQCCLEPLNPNALPAADAAAWTASPGWTELALADPTLNLAAGEVCLRFGDRYEELERLAFLEVQDSRAPGGALLVVDIALPEDEESEEDE